MLSVSATAVKEFQVLRDPPRRGPSLSVQEALAELLRALPEPDRSINGISRQLRIPASTVLRWQRGASPQPLMRRELARLCKRYSIPFR